LEIGDWRLEIEVGDWRRGFYALGIIFLEGRISPDGDKIRSAERRGTNAGTGSSREKGFRRRGRGIKVTFSYISAERMGNGDRKKRDLKKSGIFSMS
jgi:hypothetical protein